MTNQVEIQDTYAEAFRSIYAEVLITARDRFWLDHAVNACTGHASSTVSYTHLRAHETRGNLVCRLLLEKKK